MRVLIAGATGNLGRHFVRHLLANSRHQVRALIHRRGLPEELAASPRVESVHADLGDPEPLNEACRGIDCIISMAGVLFAARPERFLPVTNVEYVRNLRDAAATAGVAKLILLSFPHVEGETTPEHPASGRLDRESDVIHFRTRLEAERLVLASRTPVGVVVRCGVVYGRDVKLIEAAHWLLRHRIMAVWKQPTWVHLIALPDLLSGLLAAMEKPAAAGIYNLCDDAPLLLEEFLDTLALHWRVRRPWRMPLWVFRAAAAGCGAFGRALHMATPLNRDILLAGLTSSVSDNARRSELLPALQYPSLESGLSLL